ncbi:MAG: MerR family transcriptional regulator [Anaerolineae bacterium]
MVQSSSLEKNVQYHPAAFNLKVVLRETGLSADTLRAWERRYGLPKPERTPGGHRLYSQRDIEMIKWLMARQAEGLSISRAVELWKEQIASGRDPLADSASSRVSLPPSPRLETLRHNWIAACSHYDTISAEQILNEAFAVHSVELICTDVLLRGLYEIGELWHKGLISVHQEHFASEIAMRRVEALIAAAPPPVRSGAILTACPAGEQHVFPLALLTLFLRRRGWNVIHLGANVPTERLEETIRLVQPKLVILSAQTLVTAVSLRAMARLLQARGIPAAFGGRVFNTINLLYQRIPAYFLGNTLEISLPRIENLIAQAIPTPLEQPIPRKILDLANEYKRNQPLIEAALRQEFDAQGQAIEYLDTAISFLKEALSAALDLGDLDYISADIDWLIALLSQHRVSVSYLPVFLQRYSQATQKIMGDTGRPICDWLNLQAQKLATTLAEIKPL